MSLRVVPARKFYKCEKCKKEVEEKGRIRWAEFTYQIFTHTAARGTNYKRLDLCSVCGKKFEKFYKEFMKENNNAIE